jgi:hypothetical protein
MKNEEGKGRRHSDGSTGSHVPSCARGAARAGKAPPGPPPGRAGAPPASRNFAPPQRVSGVGAAGGALQAKLVSKAPRTHRPGPSSWGFPKGRRAPSRTPAAAATPCEPRPAPRSARDARGSGHPRAADGPAPGPTLRGRRRRRGRRRGARRARRVARQLRAAPLRAPAPSPARSRRARAQPRAGWPERAPRGPGARRGHGKRAREGRGAGLARGLQALAGEEQRGRGAPQRPGAAARLPGRAARGRRRADECGEWKQREQQVRSAQRRERSVRAAPVHMHRPPGRGVAQQKVAQLARGHRK